ncbi:MAG: DUF3153 domain-containing protein [Elainella sp.]
MRVQRSRIESAGYRTAGRAPVGKGAGNALYLYLYLGLRLLKTRLFWIILVAFLFLSGCVRDDVTLTFQDANHGAITQQVRLNPQLTGVSRAAAELWLDKLGQQTEALGGKVEHDSAREWTMTVPFYNVKDLTQKFTALFEAVVGAQMPSAESAGSLSHLTIHTNNLILWQRYRLSYDLDLRSLSLVPGASDAKTLLINPLDLFNLEFRLKTPWGAKVPADTNALTPTSQGHTLIWRLKPGQLNHLEALFWVPSPIGIGFVGIVALVLLGMFLKAWTNPSSLIDLPPDLAQSDLAQPDPAQVDLP